MEKDKVVSYFNELIGKEVFYFECFECSNRMLVDKYDLDIICSCGRLIVNLNISKRVVTQIPPGTLMGVDKDGYCYPIKNGDSSAPSIGFLSKCEVENATIITSDYRYIGTNTFPIKLKFD